MKTCFKCLQSKPRSEFYAHPMMTDGLLGKCKECTRADVQANYRAHREKFLAYDRVRSAMEHRKACRLKSQKVMRSKYPQKYIARGRVAHALRSGEMVRQSCQCGDPKSEAHHHDYSRPLDVQWLCRTCHRRAEGRLVV